MSLQAGRLLAYLLVSCVTVCQGLDMTYDRAPESHFCAQLRCDEEVSQTDDHIAFLVKLSIYNVTLAQTKVKLASVSLVDPDLCIDPSKADVINGTGSITRSQGHLALSFRDAADCLLGVFLCQVDFLTVGGHAGTITESTATDDSGHCTLIEEQLRVSTARADSLTIENSVLEGKYLDIQSKLENATQRIAMLEALVPDVACFKGMQSNTSRQEFLLWGHVPALCDTKTDDGGWVIIQRRTTGDLGFYKPWTEYKIGFGIPATDFWIGLDVIHNLTSQGYNELRFDLQYNGQNYFAHYFNFTVADELSKYRLSVGEYNGTAGDSFTYHSGMMFTTYDSDNDDSPTSCESYLPGAWWFRKCHFSHLNGVWGANDVSGIAWYNLTLYTTSLSSTEMKVRQV